MIEYFPCGKITTTPNQRTLIMADEDKKFEVKNLGTLTIVSEPKEETTDPKTGKVKPASPGSIRMSQGDLIKFYEAHGVPHAKTVLEAVNNARQELAAEAVKVLEPKVVETGSDWEFNAGIGENTVTVGIDAKRMIRNVSTGETTPRYGVVYTKVANPSPLRGAEYDDLSKRVEEAYLKKHGLK